jgi:quinolinate synthase
MNDPQSDPAQLRAQIDRLRRERRAIILAHNYQLPEIQDLADFTGDSLELSRQAAACDAPVIVFCGVHFMAETAAILAPGRTVLLPDPEAGCPMADMIDAGALRAARQKHPKATVVCYVNSSAAVKAESDICCTSGNAERVVASISGDVLFVPDRHLGQWVGRRLGRELILWDGFCPTHARITPDQIRQRRAEHPEARVLVHPECREEVVALADEVLSTGGMLRHAHSSPAMTFIVATEIGILHRLQLENPAKRFIPVSAQAVCPNMKRITLAKVARSLEQNVTQVSVPEPVCSRARLAVERMLLL